MARAQKLEVVYTGKTEQLTVYVTKDAKKKLKAAQKRGARKGLRCTAADVVNYCLLEAADGFTREAVEFIAQVELS